MKKIIFLFCFISLIKIQAQFDRMNADPVTKYPSFVGNSGKSRFAIGNSDLKTDNDLNIGSTTSFDFFSKKLKGGYGIAFSELKNSIESMSSPLILNTSICYSPKLTFRNNKQTWAPAIGIKTIYQSSYTYTYTDYKDTLTKTKTTPRITILSPYLGFSLNTNKSLIAYSLVIDRVFKSTQNNLLLSYQLDKNKSNRISSTIGTEFELNINYKALTSSQYFSPYTGTNNSSFKFRFFYDLSLGKFYLGQGLQISTLKYKTYLDDKSIYKDPTILSIRMGYKGEKLNTYISKEYNRYSKYHGFFYGLKMGVTYTFNK